jgi:hypothetical protein
MMTLMRPLRALVVLVAALTAGGSVWLDGCLVSCHTAAGKAGSAAAGHCHEATAASASVRVSSVTRCDHDHDAVWADVRDVRAASPAGGSCAQVTSEFISPAVVGAWRHATHFRPPSSTEPISFSTPLRV